MGLKAVYTLLSSTNSVCIELPDDIVVTSHVSL